MVTVTARGNDPRFRVVFAGPFSGKKRGLGFRFRVWGSSVLGPVLALGFGLWALGFGVWGLGLFMNFLLLS